MNQAVPSNVGEWRRVKVAIVEDNATLRRYLAELVGASPNCECLCACGSAEDAAARVPEVQPDVVLMDVNLPGASGIECTAHLRARIPGLRIIMLTFCRDTQILFQAIRAGVCGFISKGAQDWEILKAIAVVHAGGASMNGAVARMILRSFVGAPGALGSAAEERLQAFESELLSLVAAGYADEEIACRFHLSSAIIRARLMAVYAKFHAACRAETVFA